MNTIMLALQAQWQLGWSLGLVLGLLALVFFALGRQAESDLEEAEQEIAQLRASLRIARRENAALLNVTPLSPHEQHALTEKSGAARWN